MSIKIILFTGVMLCVIAVSAQTENKARPVKKGCGCAFSSILQPGILRGPYSSYFQAQLINGIRYKTWFAGVGAGIDYYRYKSYPVFLDVRKNIFNKAYTPFVYADAGIDLEKGNNQKTHYPSTVFKNGFYYDVGLGYKIGIIKNSGLLLSAGYSFKDVVYQQNLYAYCPYSDCIFTNLFHYKYRMNRLSLKMGWQF